MQQFSFIDLSIDPFESALHVSGDKYVHLQEHFLAVYTKIRYNAPILLPVGSNIGALYRIVAPCWLFTSLF